MGEPPTFDRIRFSRVNDVSGYIALAILGIMFTGMAMLVRLPDPIGLVVGATIWGLAWLFAIGGVRRGRGGARVAAWVSLAVLAMHAGLSLLIAYH